MAFEQSEVARLRWSIEQEEGSARVGLSGAAMIARHEFINARAQQGATRILQLIEQGRHTEAQALMDLPDWGAAATGQDPEDRFPFPAPVRHGEQETDPVRIWSPDQSHPLTTREPLLSPTPEEWSQKEAGVRVCETSREQGEQPDLVLIIDDSPTMRAILRLNLGRVGYACREFADGASALAWLRRDAPYTPRLLLLDLGLPDMDGSQVARTIRADPRWQAMPIVILTGYDRPAGRRGQNQLDAQAYLNKPFRVEQLLTVVEEVLRTPHPLFRTKELNEETSMR